MKINYNIYRRDEGRILPTPNKGQKGMGNYPDQKKIKVNYKDKIVEVKKGDKVWPGKGKVFEVVQVYPFKVIEKNSGKVKTEMTVMDFLRRSKK